jgi:predicted PurR-regulated permease PerM
MPQVNDSPDLTRTTLRVLFIGVLIVSMALIVLPFLTAFLWASTLVISTWPVLLALQKRLGGKRGLATTVMTVVLLLILVIPLSLAVGSLVSNLDSVVARASSLATFTLPPPPDWVARIPIQGPKLSAQWQRISAEGPAGFSAMVMPYVGPVLEWLARRVGGIGAMILQFLLTVIISAILYANGEAAVRGVRKFASRLGGSNGDKAVVLAGNTIRGVAMGVVVTALIQTVIAGIGLGVASVPGAGLLTAVVMLFCIAQIGPILVMLPAVIWKFYTGDTVWGSVLLVFMVLAGTLDNVIRPLLIKKGADLPLLLIFSGVIGGMITMGIMGIFVGPVILAVGFVLLQDWVERPAETEIEAVAGAASSG